MKSTTRVRLYSSSSRIGDEFSQMKRSQIENTLMWTFYSILITISHIKEKRKRLDRTIQCFVFEVVNRIPLIPLKILADDSLAWRSLANMAEMRMEFLLKHHYKIVARRFLMMTALWITVNDRTNPLISVLAFRNSPTKGAPTRVKTELYTEYNTSTH